MGTPLSKEFLLKRGRCCNNGCINCPYKQKLNNMTPDVKDLYLYGWMFNFNPYTQEWAAFKKEDYSEYWNNNSSKNIIKSNSFKTLLEILHKTKGDISNIDKKLNVKSK